MQILLKLLGVVVIGVSAIKDFPSTIGDHPVNDVLALTYPAQDEDKDSGEPEQDSEKEDEDM